MRQGFGMRDNCNWPILGFGVLIGSTSDQRTDEGSKESFAPFPRVVDELEEAQTNRQALLRDASVRT